MHVCAHTQIYTHIYFGGGPGKSWRWRGGSDVDSVLMHERL